MVNATTTPTTTPPPPADGAAPAPAGAHSGGWSKWVLLGVAVLSYVICWWVAGRLEITRTRGFDGSLLLSPGAAGNVIVTAALMLAALVLGTLLAGGIRPDAGLFAAAAGLMALTNRGRPIYAVLHDANGARGTYLTLALELLILGVLLGAGWLVLHRLQQRGHLHRDGVRDGLPDADHPASVGWSELATQVLVTAAVVALFAQSEDKKQVLAAVGIGSFAGAFFPYWKPGARPSVWYWPGPLIVGILGYVFAFATVPREALFIGRPGIGGGFLAALARPLPLDYASIGTAGSLIGYWMRRTSVRDREVAK